MGTQLPPYGLGTVNLRRYSQTVTGSGTAWKAAVTPYGSDFIAAGVNAGHILSVDSDTQITLAQPWLGADLDGQRYSIGRYLQNTDAEVLGPKVASLYETILNGASMPVQQVQQARDDAMRARNEAEAYAADAATGGVPGTIRDIHDRLTATEGVADGAEEHAQNALSKAGYAEGLAGAANQTATAANTKAGEAKTAAGEANTAAAAASGKAQDALDDVVEERTRAMEEAQLIRERLSLEETTARREEKKVADALTTETTERKSDVSGLTIRIKAEEDTSKGRDDALGVRVDTERDARIAAVTQAHTYAAGLTADEATRAKAEEKAVRTLSAPKFSPPVAPFTVLADGSGAQFWNGTTSSGATATSGGLLLPAGQHGRQSQVRSTITLAPEDVPSLAGRPGRSLLLLRVPAGFVAEMTDANGIVQFTPLFEGASLTAPVVSYSTPQADLLVIEADFTFSSVTTAFALILYVSNGNEPVTNNTAIQVIACQWFLRDAQGAGDIIAKIAFNASAYTDAERNRAIIGERRAAPKFNTVPRAFNAPASGAAKLNNLGFVVYAGQTGRGSLLRIYWDAVAGSVARNAGRDIVYIAQLKTTIGFPKAFIGTGGSADVQISFTPGPGMNAQKTTVTLLPTKAADTYILVMATTLSGSETEISADILIGGGSLAVTADASVTLNKCVWMADDDLGPTEVVSEGDAATLAEAKAYTDNLAARITDLPLAAPELVAVSTIRYTHVAGTKTGACDRILALATGKTAAGAEIIAGAPFLGIIAGTKTRFSFRYQSSTDIGVGMEVAPTQLYVYGCTINRTDGSQGPGGAAVLTRVAPGIFDVSVEWTFTGAEREIEVYLKVAAQSAARSAAGFVILRSVSLEILSAPGGITRSAQIQRVSEVKAALLAWKPNFRDFLTVALDGSGDFRRIFDANAAIGAGYSANEYNAIFVLEGDYTDECAPYRFIDQPDWVNIYGVGRKGGVRIVALFPDDQQTQLEIQPFFTKRSCGVYNITVIGKNIRYNSHNEGGNSQARAVQIYEDVVLVHYGSTGWASQSPFGIGQHQGNHLIIRRCETQSPTGGVSFHNNINWTIPASVLVEDSSLLTTGPNGQALAAVSMGAGVMSPVTVRNTTLAGYISHICTFLPGTKLANHRAFRYEYRFTLDNCSPIDWTSSCDVDCLALTSVAGASSAISFSGALFTLLFGQRPDIRKGAADRAAVAYSYHAISVLTDEEDPGVGLGARLGDRSAAPLSGTVTLDGSVTVTITADKNYTSYSNANVIADLNAKLAAGISGGAGGRAFSTARPYANRMPFHQPSREGVSVNVGTASITKGNILGWFGSGVRLMVDGDVFAGIALDDAVPNDPVRFQVSGWTNILHLIVGGSPTFAVGDLFGVGATAGVLVKGATRPLLRVRSLAAYGAVFEIIGARVGPAAAEILDASTSGRSVLTGTAAQGATALGLGTGSSPTFTDLTLSGMLSLAGKITMRGTAIIDQVAGFSLFKDGSGTINGLLIGSIDPSNYYKNTGHYFQSRDSASTYASITAAGITSSSKIRPGSVTVAGLASLGGTAGDQIYVSNARKAGEAAGAGTGVLAYYSNSNWWRMSDDTVIAA